VFAAQYLGLVPVELIASASPRLFSGFVAFEGCPNEFGIESGIGVAKPFHRVGQFTWLKKAGEHNFRPAQDEVVQRRGVRNNDAHERAKVCRVSRWSASKSAAE